MWEYGCVKCQKWHRDNEAIYAEHIMFQSKHGPREVRVPSQVTLTAGDRTLLVCVDSISVFPSDSGIRSNAAWVVTDAATLDRIVKAQEARSHITYATAWPAEVSALIWGVLRAETPVQVLMDWVIEFGPENLAAEVTLLQADVLNAKP